MRFFGLLGLFFAMAFGADGETAAIDLTTTWAGILSLIIFIVGYFFIAAEENFHIDKAKPAIFIGTFMFLLIGVYMLINGMDVHSLEHEVNHLILEIAQIVFFLMVAMTFIEALIERDVFNALKYNLVSKGYTYRKLFWLTGILAFFISPVADNLTTALILSTVLLTIDRNNTNFFSCWCDKHCRCSKCRWSMESVWRYHYAYGLGCWKSTICRLFRTFSSIHRRLVCNGIFTFSRGAKYCTAF